LGAFGQVHLGLLEGVDERLSECADLGMQDQVVALEWVRDHVASFGGDPEAVTLFGESAGAMSIGVLMAMPSATGLFHRAILQSGASRNVSSPDHANAVARGLLDALDATPEQVVDAPVDALLAAQTVVTGRLGVGVLPFQPVVDGHVIPLPPLDVLAAGALAGIDVVIGTTADEAKLFTAFVPKLLEAGDSDVARRIERTLGHDPTDLIAVYRKRLGDASPREVFDAAFTDWVFRIPAIELAELAVAAGSAVWMYEFAERSDSFEGLLGACHAIDVPFVWDNLSARGVRMILGERTDARRELASLIADAWVRFATTGDPNPAGSNEWPGYDIARRATRRFAAGAVVTVDDPNGDERRLWPVRAPESR
ncbi:MAG: carboxylesterase family protein, partial [Acidimicrobiales bacterium]